MRVSSGMLLPTLLLAQSWRCAAFGRMSHQLCVHDGVLVEYLVFICTLEFQKQCVVVCNVQHVGVAVSQRVVLAYSLL